MSFIFICQIWPLYQRDIDLPATHKCDLQIINTHLGEVQTCEILSTLTKSESLSTKSSRLHVHINAWKALAKKTTTKFPWIFPPFQPKSANLKVAARIEMSPQDTGSFRNALGSIYGGKIGCFYFSFQLLAKIPSLFCWATCIWARMRPLLSTWPAPTCSPAPHREGLDFDPDLAQVRRKWSWTDFISLPATPKWWLTPDLFLQIYSCLQGRGSLPFNCSFAHWEDLSFF